MCPLCPFLWFYLLLGPFIFTFVNIKKRPNNTYSALYGLGSCPLAIDIVFLHMVLVILDKICIVDNVN